MMNHWFETFGAGMKINVAVSDGSRKLINMYMNQQDAQNSCD